jgi:uncharacterized membrane protein YhaH (DUF805 family)
MSPKEETSLRQLYATWPLERLARTASLEKKDYLPEAVAIMFEELERRGMSADSVPEFASATPPPLPHESDGIPVTDTWLFPARLSRRRYGIRSAVFLIGAVALAVLLELIPILQPASFVILAGSSFLYCAIGLVLPRGRDAGMPSWMAIMFVLFPITAFGTFLILFFVPSNKGSRANQPPQTTRASGPRV